MEKNDFFIKSAELEYRISNKEISNYFIEEYDNNETPSVFYLNLRYKDEIYLPVTLFKKDLTPLQIIVKYLKENLNKTNRQIALLLNRDPKTTWATYKSIEKKKTIIPEESQILIPINIFTDRRLSILESLVWFLKNLDMKYSEVARLLNRDQRTIWTVCSRAKDKLGKNE